MLTDFYIYNLEITAQIFVQSNPLFSELAHPTNSTFNLLENKKKGKWKYFDFKYVIKYANVYHNK